MLKLYSFDQSWAGVVVVVASSPEIAVDLIRKAQPYQNTDLSYINVNTITVTEVVDGAIIVNYGDL